MDFEQHNDCRLFLSIQLSCNVRISYDYLVKMIECFVKDFRIFDCSTLRHLHRAKRWMEICSGNVISENVCM